MFTVYFGMLLLITVMISGAREPCKKMLINSDQMYGECCVFNKNESVKFERNFTNGNINLGKNANNRRPSHRLRSPHNISYPRPITAHHRPPENIVLSIDNDKVYGECSIFIKDAHLRHNKTNIAAIILKNLAVTNITEEKVLLINQTLLRDIPQHQKHNNSDTVNDEPEVTKRLETYPGNGTNRRKILIRHRVKSPTTVKYEPSNSRVITETTEEIVISTEIPKKPEEADLMGFRDDNSSDIMFPTEESILTTIRSSNDSNPNATSIGKTLVDLGNRNAVDVPAINCPNGQGRDPTGKCVSPF